MDAYYNDSKLMITNSTNGGESFNEPMNYIIILCSMLIELILLKMRKKIILSLQHSFDEIILFESNDDGQQFDFLTEIQMYIYDISSMFYKSTNLSQDNVLYFCGKHSFFRNCD